MDANAFENTRLISAIARKQNKFTEDRLRIPVLDISGKFIGSMQCMDLELMRNDAILCDLTEWRQNYMRFFITQFDATVLRTRDWLENIVIPSADRIFFIIYSDTNQAIGNFGICNLNSYSGELDNLIRGRKGGDSKLIYYCEIALLAWMFKYLEFNNVFLHVFSNNKLTIKLHTSVGFTISASHSLTKIQSADGIHFLLNSMEGEPVNFSYLTMQLDKASFLKLHPWVSDIYQSLWNRSNH